MSNHLPRGLPRAAVAPALLLPLGLLAATPPAAAAPLNPTLTTIPSDPRPVSPVVGNRRFAVALHRALAAGDPAGNLAFSPYGMSTALAMVARGAAGATLNELRDALHLPEGPDAHADLGTWRRSLTPGPGAILDLTNRLFGHRDLDFAPDYLADLARDHGAKLETIDFKGATEAARQRVNDWVAEATRDRIRDLLPPGSLHPRDRLVLVNAVYFRAPWATAFPPGDTYPEPFWVGGTNPTPRPFMHLALAARSREGRDYTLVELPFQGEEVDLVLVVPRARDGLARLEAVLRADRLESLLAGAQFGDVELALPRFAVRSRLDLPEVLKGLGIERVWDEDSANLSRMCPEVALYLSKGFHQAFVQVEEEGAEAAAATALVARMQTAILRPRTRTIRVDRPFLYLIRHRRTGTWVFMGRVSDPGA